jgi:hypothetical protein
MVRPPFSDAFPFNQVEYHRVYKQNTKKGTVAMTGGLLHNKRSTP